jgi:hypothetical protein
MHSFRTQLEGFQTADFMCIRIQRRGMFLGQERADKLKSGKPCGISEADMEGSNANQMQMHKSDRYICRLWCTICGESGSLVAAQWSRLHLVRELCKTDREREGRELEGGVVAHACQNTLE